MKFTVILRTGDTETTVEVEAATPRQAIRRALVGAEDGAEVIAVEPA